MRAKLLLDAPPALGGLSIRDIKEQLKELQKLDGQGDTEALKHQVSTGAC